MTNNTFQRLLPTQVDDWLAQHPAALILDARDPASHATASFANSLLLDGRNHELLLLNTARSHPVFIYCYHGNASQSYAQMFIDFGFATVVDLVDGWQAWQEWQQNGHSPVTVGPTLAAWLAAQGYTGIDIAGAHGNTPLMHAAWKNDVDAVEALLAHGASVNPVNNDGNTALWLACVSNNPVLVRRLVCAGAAINHGNATGATCLMYAASSSKPAIVATLLELGADPLLQSQDDFTALDMAASIECLQLLRAATRTQALSTQEAL